MDKILLAIETVMSIFLLLIVSYIITDTGMLIYELAWHHKHKNELPQEIDFEEDE